MVNDASRAGVPAPTPELSGAAAASALPATADDASASRVTTWATVLVAGAVFVVSLALDLRTLLRDVSYWDTGEFQTIGAVLGIAHPTGYPTYTLLDWLASVVFQPFGSPAFRADLLSAVLVSAACALLAVAAIQLTHRTVLGLLAGIALAVSPLGWSLGLAADPHALHVFLSALLLVLLLAWQSRVRSGRRNAAWLVAASIVFGLSLGNHALTVLLAPGVGLFVLIVEPELLRRRWRVTLACLAALAITTVAVYAYIPLRAAMNPPLDYADPVTWDRFKYLVLGQQFQGTFHAMPSLGNGLNLIWNQLVANIGVIAVLSIAGAIVSFLRNLPFAILAALWFGLTFVFALGYENAAIERYYLVPLMIAIVWMTLALDAIWRGLETFVLSTGSRRLVAVGGTVVAALLIVVLLLPVPGRLPRQDRSDDTGARAWMDATLASLAPDAVIVSWWNYSTPLWYGQFVEGKRPDVKIIDDRNVLDEGYGTAQNAIDAFLGKRPVYLVRVDYDLPAYRARYNLEPIAGVPAQPSGTVYRVMPLSGTQSGTTRNPKS
jgi:Protein O-mannosyl-transferase TMEM260-like